MRAGKGPVPIFTGVATSVTFALGCGWTIIRFRFMFLETFVSSKVIEPLHIVVMHVFSRNNLGALEFGVSD